MRSVGRAVRADAAGPLDSVDQQAHIALLLHAAGRPIGVGRLRRYAADLNLAHLAVTVADDRHGRGAGALLAREVLARASGVREIHTVVAETTRPHCACSPGSASCDRTAPTATAT